MIKKNISAKIFFFYFFSFLLMSTSSCLLPGLPLARPGLLRRLLATWPREESSRAHPLTVSLAWHSPPNTRSNTTPTAYCWRRHSVGPLPSVLCDPMSRPFSTEVLLESDDFFFKNITKSAPPPSLCFIKDKSQNLQKFRSKLTAKGGGPANSVNLANGICI